MSEGGHDVVQHPSDPDGGVRQVDDHVPGGVQGGGGGADGDGFPGADLAGDHPQCVLFHAPGDAGDSLPVAGVAVQHLRRQVPPEWHPGEPVVGLQPVDTHDATRPSISAASIRSVNASWPGTCPAPTPSVVSVTSVVLSGSP